MPTNNDTLAAIIAVIVVLAATVYGKITNDHQGNAWNVYLAVIGYVAGRSGSPGHRK